MSIAPIIIKRIQENDPTLTELNLSYQRLDENDIQKLVEALQSNTYLKALDLAGNTLRDTGAEALAQTLNLTSLDLSDCQLTSKAAEHLAKNRQLVKLNLTDNLIDEKGAIALAANKTLTSLVLTGNRLGDAGASILAQSTTLTALNVGFNKIGFKGAQAFAENSTLAHLNISHNQIGIMGAIAFGLNKTLRELYARSNQINDKGTTALAKNTMLEKLDLCYNQISDVGVQAFAQNSSLTELDLSHNQLSGNGAKALAQLATLITLNVEHNLVDDEGVLALSQHKRLQWLDLTANQISFEGAYSLGQNKTLTTLILSSNSLGDAAVMVLARSASLTELGLSHNQVSDAGAIILAENTRLRKLNLNNNPIGPKGKDILRKNESLTFLEVAGNHAPDFAAEAHKMSLLLAQDFLCIYGEDGLIHFFNPALARMLGYKTEELFAQPFTKLLHPLDQKTFEMRSPAQQEHPFTFESRHLCTDGSYRMIRWVSKLKNKLIYAAGCDITEQRKLELALSASQRETVAVRLQEAADHMQKQTDFIAHLCHEIRNPLNGLLGLTEMMETEHGSLEHFCEKVPSPLKEELTEKLKAMGTTISDMKECEAYQKSILDDNLDLTRVIENKFTLANQPYDLKKAIEESLALWRRKAAQNGLTLTMKMPEQALVKGDVMRVKQIITNLIGNAIKFTEKGSITIMLTLQEQTSSTLVYKIDVIDTGGGIGPQAQLQLFKRFTQASPTVEGQYGGSGLGLYISKTLAQAMGGDIQLTSEKGKGSTFSCVLKFERLSEQEEKELTVIKRPKKPAPQKTQTSPLAASSLFPPPIKRTVLIVEDVEINRKILIRMLEKAGYHCLVAKDGQEALAAYDQQAMDIILMDIIMPNMDGITATQEIRKREKDRPRVPIIAISGNALEADKIKARETGVDGYLTKPFNKEELLEMIEALIKANIKPTLVPSASATSSASCL